MSMKITRLSWLRGSLLMMALAIAMLSNAAKLTDVIGYNWSTSGTNATLTKYTINKVDGVSDSLFYTGDENNIVNIPETFEHEGITYTVVAIDDNAFVNCRDIKEIHLPETCVKFGKNCFRGCTSLTNYPVTITANNLTMVYGDEVPELTYKTEGAALEGTPSLTTTATKTSAVGTYPINVGVGSVTNTKTTYVAGTLTITKAPLTVGVKNETITEGDVIPAFTLTYSGFRNSDTEATAFTKKPVAKTTATKTSPAGTYPITVSGGEAKNYALTYGQGTLTIEEKEVDGISSVKADEQPNSATYNLAGQKVNAQYKGIVIRNGRKVVK